MVPRGGLPRVSRINELECQTSIRGSFDPQRFSGEVSNRDRRCHVQQAAPVNVQSSHRQTNILEILPDTLLFPINANRCIGRSTIS